MLPCCWHHRSDLNSFRTALPCTDSRPRARWYQLRGLPLVDSECVCPQCNSSFVITRGVPSHRRSAFPSISQELTRNAKRKSGTPVTVNSPTVKCPMVRPQRYRSQLFYIYSSLPFFSVSIWSSLVLSCLFSCGYYSRRPDNLRRVLKVVLVRFSGGGTS